MLIRLSEADPRKTCSNLKRDVVAYRYGVSISNTSVKRRLLKVERMARKSKKAAIDKENENKRLASAKKYKNWTMND